MFRTRDDVTRFIGDQMEEHNRARAEWKADKAEAGLLLACAQGIQGAWQASPDAFAPFDFTVADAAAVLASWIQSQPRR